MNNINIDTNKIRSYGYEIIKQAEDFKKLSSKIIYKCNYNESKKFEDFYIKLCKFGKMYEQCANKLEESMLNNKYE